MSKFIIEKPVWDLFPELSVGIVVAKGVDNSDTKEEELKAELASALESANEDAKKHLTSDVISENEVVAVWRKAYQQFKTKKGVRCSIEALLKRASKGNAVSNINPLVDIYNVISLKYALPCGGEDMDKFVGDLRLTQTVDGGDEFLALGDKEKNRGVVVLVAPNEHEMRIEVGYGLEGILTDGKAGSCGDLCHRSGSGKSRSDT